MYVSSRPHVEAMSMGLPVIATNWSGPTEYMTEENAYPLRLSGMQEIKKVCVCVCVCMCGSLSRVKTA